MQVQVKLSLLNPVVIIDLPSSLIHCSSNLESQHLILFTVSSLLHVDVGNLRYFSSILYTSVSVFSINTVYFIPFPASLLSLWILKNLRTLGRAHTIASLESRLYLFKICDLNICLDLFCQQ